MVHTFLEKQPLLLIDVYKNSAGMMLTNEIEHYMQQWHYFKIRQAKAKFVKR